MKAALAESAAAAGTQMAEDIRLKPQQAANIVKRNPPLSWTTPFEITVSSNAASRDRNGGR